MGHDGIVWQLLLIVGHSEYWSARMYRAVDTFLADGGRVIMMSGNSMYPLAPPKYPNRLAPPKYPNRLAPPKYPNPLAPPKYPIF